MKRTEAVAFSVDAEPVDLKEFFGDTFAGQTGIQSTADLPQLGVAFEGLFYAPCQLYFVEKLNGQVAFLKYFQVTPLTKTKSQIIQTIYVHNEHTLHTVLKIPGMKWFLGHLASKVLGQDISILSAQAERVARGVRSMNNNVPSDTFSQAISSLVNDELNSDEITIVQQDAQYQGVYQGPWFQKWEQVEARGKGSRSHPVEE